MRAVDEQREAKRRKVINEFHETEKSYVDGLELIYSVRVPCASFVHSEAYVPSSTF